MKEQLLHTLRYAYDAELAFAHDLSEADRSAVGTLEHWSAKDVIAHIVAWKKRMVERLDIAAQGGTPAPIEDLDHENAGYYAAYEGKSWDDILHEHEQTNRTLFARVEAMSEDTLTDPAHFPWLNGQAMWRRLVGNGCEHPLIHLAEYHAKHGQPERGLMLQENAADMLMMLDDSPEWQSIPIYNLACYYALCGRTDKAIEHLAHALQMNPGLSDWSKQDPDLDSLRRDPRYLALYEA